MAGTKDRSRVNGIVFLKNLIKANQKDVALKNVMKNRPIAMFCPSTVSPKFKKQKRLLLEPCKLFQTIVVLVYTTR